MPTPSSPSPKRSQSKSAGPAAGTSYETTLRMPRQEIDAIRHSLDTSNSEQAASQRHYRRWPFERLPVTIKIMHPGGMNTTLPYACRNLSNGGMSVLHSSFVHNGTRCIVTLPHAAKGTIDVPGQVTRCRHCKGKVHEIGIRFDASIDVREVLEIDPSDYSLILENIKPESLSGGVLVIDSSELDRVLIRRCLRETNLNVVTVNEGTEGLRRATEGFDLIICDVDLSDMSGPDLLAKLREQHIHTPVIFLSGEPTANAASFTGDVTPDGVLTKPFKPQRFLGAVAQFLLADEAHRGTNSILCTSLAPNDPAYPLVESFLRDLKNTSGNISLAITRSDTVACRRMVFQIKGNAASYGFEAIAKVADEAYTAISGCGDISECTAVLNRLLAVCARARMKNSSEAA